MWESSTLDHNSETLIGTQHDPADTLCAMVVIEGWRTMDACCNHTPFRLVYRIDGGGRRPSLGYVWSPDHLSDPDANDDCDPGRDHHLRVDGQIGDCQVSSSVTAGRSPSACRTAYAQRRQRE